jgi:hypothetical protein
MDHSSGLQTFETTFARLAFDLAAASDTTEAMTSLLAAQRSALLEPLHPMLLALASIRDEGAQLDLRLPRGLEVSRRVGPLISEFLVEAVRNWKAHGKQSRAERKFSAKDEQCRVDFSIEVTSSGLKLAFHDDGPGLNPSMVVDRLKRLGLVAGQELAALELAGVRGELDAIYPWIFRDGVTTRVQPGPDAGNGMGLSRIHKLCSELGGRTSAGVSARLGGFQLTMEVPCSLLGMAVEPLGGSLARELVGDGVPTDLAGEFRIFYRMPSESRAWASQAFGGVPVSWMSLETSGAERSGFKALGLRSDAANV